jgi:hypothetical protein
MNKQELLQDLESKSFVDAINGEPELKETKADGGKWYLVNIREVNPDGDSATYRNIHFYVVDEGLETEKAYYKDSIPTEITDKAYDFTEKVKNYIDNATDRFDIERISEERELAIVKRYTEGTDLVAEERYFVFMKDGKLAYKKIG